MEIRKLASSKDNQVSRKQKKPHRKFFQDSQLLPLLIHRVVVSVSKSELAALVFRRLFPYQLIALTTYTSLHKTSQECTRVSHHQSVKHVCFVLVSCSNWNVIKLAQKFSPLSLEAKSVLSQPFLCLKTNVNTYCFLYNICFKQFKLQELIKDFFFFLGLVWFFWLTMLETVKPKQPQDVSLIGSFENSLESFGER